MNSNFTMRDMAVTERPYEKCQQSGPSALNDAELLAVILLKRKPKRKCTGYSPAYSEPSFGS